MAGPLQILELASPDYGIDGLHLFAFDQVAAALEWQARIAGRS